jgi:hypothetical protein
LNALTTTRNLGTWTYGGPKTPTLAQIQRIEQIVGAAPQIDCPVEHFFAPGMYVRKCSIPAGSIVVGKMHRHVHPVMLTKGEVTINTDKGMERITAPHVWISQLNAKRALYTHSDCEFVTVHLNEDDATDLDVIEARVIVPDAQIDYHKEVEQLAEFADELQGVYA